MPMVIEVTDMALHYEIAGEGAPLLWLHGFMGAGADWRYIFGDAPDGFRVIAPDLRGHGASVDPSGQFSFRQAARDVAALLRHLEVDTVKAIGVSGGGITLLHMATAAPASIESMVIVSAPPYFPDQARAFQRQFSPDSLAEADLESMRQRHAEPGQLDRLFAEARAFADSYDDVNFTPPLLGRISADTLIVFGDRDPLYPVDLATDLRRAIPRSYLWVVPNGGHAPVFGPAAPAFSQSALAFLRGQWRAPGE
jgi:pimeloyl-ACP methyl ester carboxylesterase